MSYYIQEGLEKIKNSSNVNIIKPVMQRDGISLCAKINGGDIVQLTMPVGRMSFPFEPIKYLGKEFGNFYMKNFAIIANKIAINKEHLIRLGYEDTSKNRVRVYALFDDGTATQLFDQLKKYFFKKFKEEIEQICEMQCEDVTKQAVKYNNGESRNS